MPRLLFVRKHPRLDSPILFLLFGVLIGYLISRLHGTRVMRGVHYTGGVLTPENNCCKSRKSLAELADVYNPTKFTLSHTAYQRFYPLLLEVYRDLKFKMLEIGIESGRGSLLWKEYFPRVDLWGLDINQATSETKGAQSISIVIGSQSNRTFLENDFLSITGGGFDVIIDDGGHHYEQQSLSYQVLFDKALKPGGWYIIEDIETSFWGKGENLYGSALSRGGCESKDTLFRDMQRLAEVVNKKFIDNDITVFGNVDHWVKSIMFGSNIVMLQKKDEQDCFSEDLYTWPHLLANNCPAAFQANRTTYPPEKFTLHTFCSNVRPKKDARNPAHV